MRWNSAGVNSVLIFELDPRNCHSAWTVLWLSSVFCLIWTVSFMTFALLDTAVTSFYILPILFPTAFRVRNFYLSIKLENEESDQNIVSNPCGFNFMAFHSTFTWTLAVYESLDQKSLCCSN